MRFVSNDAEAPLYVHADHLGTPQKMTDQATTLAWDRVQKPFGETVSLTGAAANPQRFPGQLNDPETGFHYNYFRDYDPTIGRYLQSDPIGLAGGLNTYGYVGGNPARYFDPLGLFTTVVCRPLNYPWIKYAAKHCSVFVWDYDECGNKVITRQFTLEENGTKPLEQGSYGNDVYQSDFDAFTNPGEGNEHFPIAPPPGTTQQDFDDLVTEQGDSFSQDPYQPFTGPNSNTATDDIVEGAGGTVPDVPWAWGQNYGDLPGSGPFGGGNIP